MNTGKFNVTGMTCAACQANVTRRVQKLEGVQSVEVNLLSGRMTVEYDESVLSPQSICEAVEQIGYGASDASSQPAAQGKPSSDFRSEWQARRQRAQDGQTAMKRRLIASICLLVPLMYVAMGAMLGLPMPAFLEGTQNAIVSALTQLLLTAPVLLINRHFYQSGFKALVHRAPNMDSLVAVGSSASLLYGIFAMYRMAYGFGHGDMAVVHEYAHALYFESAAMILTLVTVGKYLEARSKSKTSDALGKLTKYKLRVSIDDQRVYVYGLDSFGQYELDRTFICSTGLGDSTPTGIYTTSTEPLNRWQYFQKFKCWAQYSFRITGNIWFHSVLYSAPDTSTLRYGSVAALGGKASHGCVRLKVEDAKWIFENCEAGTIVEVY